MVDVGSAVGYLLLDTSGFKSGFESAFSDMKAFMDKSTTLSDKTLALGNSMKKVGSSLTKYVTLPLVGVATASMKVGNDFEAQMSRVQAISGATSDELEKLTDQALQLGADTSFSASEAASGMENLASAGFTTNEIIEAMPGLLDLAASSGADLATASDIAASAVRGFGLEASETAHVADVFAEAAARTNAQTEDMGEAMKYVAPVANAMGQSIEMTAAAIGIMSDAGIKGSQAGTTIRGALSRLAKPTDDMIDKMDELGLSFYDAEGNMLPLTEIVGQLETNMADLTQEQRNNALVTLFGQESLSGMLALMDRGSDELAAMTKDFENADGAASSMADTMLNNTAGAIEQMMGSLETLGIKIQQVMAPAVTSVVNKITEFVNMLSSLDEGKLRLVVTIAGIAAAVGPVLLVLGKIIVSISSIITAVSNLSVAFGAVSTVIGGFIAPVAAIMAAIAGLYILWQTDFNGMRDTVSSVFESIQSIISSVMTIVQSVVELVLGVIVSLWQSNFANIQGIVKAVFNTIQSILENAFAVIADIFAVFANLFSGNWSGLWESVKKLFSDAWNLIVSLLGNFLNLIIQTIIGIVGGVYEAMSAVANAAYDAFEAGWNALCDWLEGVVEDPVGTILGIGDAMYNAGSEILGSMLDGLKSMWENITSWVGEAVDWLVDKVTFWESESAKMNLGSTGRSARGSGIQGSFASGLDYVPRDMNVRVHEGEAIITKEENKERSDSARVLTIEVPLVINGKKVAKAIAKDVDIELGKQRG